MNKSDIIDSVAKELDKLDFFGESDNIGIYHKKTRFIFDKFIEEIINGVQDDGKVSLTGFGNFIASDRKPRRARNPKTGEMIDVPGKTVPVFRAAPAFKSVFTKE